MAISFAYSTDYNPSAPVVEITVKAEREVTLQALLDSGADATMISITTLRTIKARFARTHSMRGVIGRARSVELYFVEIQIGSYKIPGIRAVAAEAGAQAIIGRDVLNQLIVTLDGISGITDIS